MKALIISISILSSITTNAQYFQRWFGSSTLPAKSHAFYDGLCTQSNFVDSNINFYNVAVGIAELIDSNAQQLSPYNELRFVRTNRNGDTVDVNNGYSFSHITGPDTARYHSAGFGICEIDADNHNGGYIVVGSVADNVKTGAEISGGESDALICRISNTGIISMKYRIDFYNGTDVLRHVVASKINTNQFYACGTSTFDGNSHVIVLKFNMDGKIIWGNSYRIRDIANETPDNMASGFSLCEDESGNIIVAGSIYNPDNSNYYDGLLLGLNGSTGSVNFYYTADFNGTDEAFRSIRQTDDGDFIICGYTDQGADYDILLLKMTITSSGVTSTDFEKKITIPGVLEERGYDVIERINSTSGIAEYYVAGSLQIGGIINSFILKTGGDGVPVNAYYPYSNMDYLDAVALDYSDLETSSSGLKLFSNHHPTIGSNNNGYLARTYFNGASCTAFCPSFPASDENVDPSSSNYRVAKIANKTRKSIKHTSFSYASDYICNSLSEACGSSARLANEEILKKMAVLIYPNPANHVLTVESEIESATSLNITIMDMTGKQLIALTDYAQAGKWRKQIDLAGLSVGVYFLSMHTDNGLRAMQKFVKE